jgi:GNAT superfamily N-acetyltransferase
MPNSFNVQFRQAKESDLPVIVQLLVEDELSAHRERYETPLSRAYYEALKAIGEGSNNEVIVAEIDGEVIGTLQLTFIPCLSYQGGTRAQVESVRVVERLRGQGIGTVMMEWALDRARQRGCPMMQLTSHKSRADAHRFYEKLGFTASHIGMKKNLES